jgi:hypothetical protein
MDPHDITEIIYNLDEEETPAVIARLSDEERETLKESCQEIADRMTFILELLKET